MKHELVPLSYGYADLEPHIDARTMEVHYTKHYQGYADKLNAALAAHPELYEKPVEDLLKNLSAVPEDIRIAVQNNGGGYYNHTLFWSYMSPKPADGPGGDLLGAISRDLEGFEAFKESFAKAAAGRFGSGWAWLVLAEGKLQVTTTANQDSPVSLGHVPLLGIDVWEHAYYLAYQNRRTDYIDAWWHVVDWKRVDEYYRAATAA